jgi:hypothetical protein
MSPPSSGPKNKQSRFFYLLQYRFLLGLFFEPEERGDMFLPKRQLTSNGLYGIISQKTEFFKMIPECDDVEWLWNTGLPVLIQVN